ncbi:aldehyde-activating protein [Novosphingobium sp. PC22D]|uniref:GFA family protein n=1 Tax=Novosphingobium sp. PC22D TaxID=1962403 RepID=UPI000BEF4849|nr:GFA family protein [Novosphingobium sp. PC22D]PEQ11207.1 aldehyde-activating protein [Novosphingobium sp. PC22D]
MPAPYHGRCNCGAVTLSIEAEPVWVRQCWCRQCQRIAGGSATSNALVMTDKLATRGEIHWWEYEAQSGNVIGQGFCPNCGTHLLGRNSARSIACVVRLGVLDEAAELAPTSIIWTDEAPAWALLDPALERFARQPPAPGTAT